MKYSYVTFLVFILCLLSCSYRSEEDAMRSCVKWGTQGVSVRSYKYGLTSHNRECVYNKGKQEVIGYEKDSNNKLGKNLKVKIFAY